MTGECFAPQSVRMWFLVLYHACSAVAPRCCSFGAACGQSCPRIVHAQTHTCCRPLCRPGGIRQQFKAATPLVEQLLRRVKQLPGLEGPLNAEVLDEGDAVGAWTSKNIATILFPTPGTYGCIPNTGYIWC